MAIFEQKDVMRFIIVIVTLLSVFAVGAQAQVQAFGLTPSLPNLTTCSDAFFDSKRRADSNTKCNTLDFSERGWDGLQSGHFGAEPDAFVSLHRPRLQNFSGLTQNRPSGVALPCRALALSASERLTGTILRKSYFCV